jgi:hypothetical protein
VDWGDRFGVASAPRPSPVRGIHLAQGYIAQAFLRSISAAIENMRSR